MNDNYQPTRMVMVFHQVNNGGHDQPRYMWRASLSLPVIDNLEDQVREAFKLTSVLDWHLDRSYVIASLDVDRPSRAGDVFVMGTVIYTVNGVGDILRMSNADFVSYAGVNDGQARRN